MSNKEPGNDDVVEEAAQPSNKAAKTAGRMGRKGKPSSKKPSTPKEKKPRRSFPAATFEEALALPLAIQQHAPGQKIRRLTLFDQWGKSPDSGPSRQLITNASRYGLTSGSYQAEYLELTPQGKIATDPEVSAVEQLRVRFNLGIESIEPFKTLYDQLKGNKLPSQAVMRDALLEQNYETSEVGECVDTFILNAKFLGLLRQVAGAERLLPIEHVIEELEKNNPGVAGAVLPQPTVPSTTTTPSTKAASSADTWETVCFYITPIGDVNTEERKHADLFLSSIVEPALEEFGLRLVRADQIGQAGMITRQIIEHIVNARLVIADLSFHNPNVFYELCLRHVCRKPTVQVIRIADKIPFDLDQTRTIRIDTTSIYTLVPQLETYRSEISNQVRRALADPDAVDNPVSVFFPALKTTFS